MKEYTYIEKEVEHTPRHKWVRYVPAPTVPASVHRHLCSVLPDTRSVHYGVQPAHMPMFEQIAEMHNIRIVKVEG